MLKKEFRNKYKELRSRISEHKVKSHIIADGVINNCLFKNSSDIFLYFPSHSEVLTLEIFDAAVSLGKRVAFPKCMDGNGKMEFYYINSIEELITGMYGIREPDSSVAVKAVPGYNTLIIVPALAFDICGYRLGYGKGYYDRYLDEHPCKSIGIAFNECVCEALPHDSYDKKIDCLVTDKSIYYFD